MVDFFTLEKFKSYPLIKDVIVRPLKVNRDKRGILVETIKKTWTDIYGVNKPFSQNYFSITEPNVARDEHQWHIHPKKQIDRFVVVKGNLVLAMADARKDSPTFRELNLFKMGDSNKDNGRYLLLVPKSVLHCFLTIGKKEVIILNFPTQLYDPKEEGRLSFNKFKLKDGSYFSWDLVRERTG